MARNLDPKCRQCRRREGEKLFLKGEKCFTDKCHRASFVRARSARPKVRCPLSDYGVHLRAKQKIRRVYGVLEGQFRKTFAEAERRKGQTGETCCNPGSPS